MEIDCLAAMARAGPLERFRYEPGDPGENDVLVSVECCGLCGDDLHYLDDDLGLTQYPFVPGHEIVGNVASRGRGVVSLKEGDRVGIGWQAGSCGACEWCRRGQEQLCPAARPTFSPYGGFATSVTVNERFAVPLPARIPSESAAPLLCAGASAYAALQARGARPAPKVGIVGIGAMGHLAIQFAHAFGCEVTACSSTPGKREDARRLGAHHFVPLEAGRFPPGSARSLDLVISTVPCATDVDSLLLQLRAGGTLCLAGLARGRVAIDPFVLASRQVSIHGGPAVGRETIREVLAFAEAHGIGARAEVVPMEQANEAIARLGSGQARYVVVLRAA